MSNEPRDWFYRLLRWFTRALFKGTPVLLVLTLAHPAAAQGSADFGATGQSAVNAFDGMFTPRLELPAADRKYAEWSSDITVAASLAADTWWSWKQPHRRAAFACQGLRDGSIILISEIVKRLVKRARPPGAAASGYSFWSEHTALTAGATGGYGIGFVLPISLGTAAGRISGGDHWASDTLVGGAFGSLVGHYTRGCK